MGRDSFMAGRDETRNLTWREIKFETNREIETIPRDRNETFQFSKFEDETRTRREILEKNSRNRDEKFLDPSLRHASIFYRKEVS